MSEFTDKKLKEARVKKGLSHDEAANLMNVAKRAISEIEAGKRSISADELAQFSPIYNVDVRELLFVEFTEAGDEQRLTAKYSSFLKLLKALPIIDEWLENDNPNTRRAVTEGLRIWTSRPYFKDNPNEAIRRIVA